MFKTNSDWNNKIQTQNVKILSKSGRSITAQEIASISFRKFVFIKQKSNNTKNAMTILKLNPQKMKETRSNIELGFKQIKTYF